MKLYVQTLESWLHPSDVFITLHGNDSHSFWLDREHHPSHRYSVVGGSNGLISEPRASLEEHLRDLHWTGYNEFALPFEFRPGLVGAFGYEPEFDRFLKVDRALVFDHDNRAIYFVGVFDEQEQFSHWTQAALLRLALVGGEQAQYRIANGGGEVWAPTLRHEASEYLAMIEKAQEHIAEGDVYQVCLTNEIRLETTVDPLLTFLRLREQNPAPYSAFMRLGDASLVSASPEQFLEADATGKISSKPIKGTRRRGATANEDQSISLELAADAKERAENLMIVDLMRNDLGQVCEVGSIDVPKLFEVETYATVHQLVSTVTGTLKAGVNVLLAVDAAFPGGSMTGAPKIRAMEIIKQLEVGNRGNYSGAMGYIAANGAAELGMVIRTLVFRGGFTTIGVGGGITIDSDPVAELEETKLKAKALLRALGADDPWG